VQDKLGVDLLEPVDDRLTALLDRRAHLFSVVSSTFCVARCRNGRD
jgi:hypothetical protein